MPAYYERKVLLKVNDDGSETITVEGQDHSESPIVTAAKDASGNVVGLGYKGTPIDEKCIKNFRVSRPARTWTEMLEQTAAIE